MIHYDSVVRVRSPSPRCCVKVGNPQNKTRSDTAQIKNRLRLYSSIILCTIKCYRSPINMQICNMTSDIHVHASPSVSAGVYPIVSGSAVALVVFSSAVFGAIVVVCWRR